MKHRILAAALAAAVCLGIICAFVPAALAFSDVTDTEMAEAVEVLSGLGIVDGYSDGSYHPGDSLTRAQFCKLAVLAEGHGDQVSGSSYRTLFSDVPGTNWAAPYINLAYQEGLVSGYGDGTFGPEDPVTLGQAVTIVLHLMGYSDDDIGPFWPQDYMSKAEALGLTDGISKSSGQSLNRGEAALLLYAMLKSDDAQGTDYIAKLCASAVTDAVVLDNDAESTDGTQDTAMVYANGNLSYYEQSARVADALMGIRGTLLLDKTGKVSGFLPGDTASRSVSAKEVTAAAITDTSGREYSISSSTAVILDDEKTTYSACWYDLEDRDTITLYYSASGSIDLVVAAGGGKYEGVLLTGYYENAVPNAANPTSIQILGMSLDIADGAESSVGQFSVGDRITVSLDASGDVTGAWAAASKKTDLYGVLDSVGTNASITLTCGLTASGELSSNSSAASSLVGSLVRVSSSGIGKISISEVSGGSANKLNVTASTLGTIPLADDIAVYERVGTSTVVSLEMDDILFDSVAASKIDFYATNSSGEVSVLLLNDVTGNAYTYGLLKTGQEKVASIGNGDSESYNTTVGVENSTSDGSKMYVTGNRVSDSTYGGIAVSGEGKAVSVVTLTRAAGIPRSDFDGLEATVVNGVRIPVADEVQVYNTEAKQWTTLEEAKSFASSFTVYYDKSPSSGGQIRVILTE